MERRNFIKGSLITGVIPPLMGNRFVTLCLMNRINQNGLRPQDTPISLKELNPDDQAIIARYYPELFRKTPG